MRRLFKQEGMSVGIASNKPLLLSGEGAVWLVREGHVDLFAVRGEKGDAGARRYLFRVESGQALFGMGTEGEKDLHLLAVGTQGTSLWRLDFSRFLELAPDPAFSEAAANLIHCWVSGLSLGARKDLLPPKVFVELQPGENLDVEKGGNVRPASGTLWGSHLEGASFFMGRRGLPPFKGGSGSFFPLSSQAWLEADDGARLRALDTAAYLRHDPSLSGLAEFHRLIADCIALSQEEEDEEERRRLEAKAANDRIVFKNALSRLGTILDQAAPATVAAEGSGNPLFAACVLVGEKLGIPFRAPRKEEMAGRNPLDAIARTSKVRFRQVALSGDWYRHDHGPLLAFTAEGENPVALLPATPRSYILHDPASGTQTKVTPEAAASLTPFGYVFYRPFPDQAMKGWDLVRFSLAGCSRDIWMMLAVATLGAVLGLVGPIAMGIIINTIIPSAARSDLGQITLVLITCAMATAAFDVTRAVSMLRIESKMDASMQAGVMDRLLSLPVPFFRDFTSGDLAERTLGINAIRQLISGVTVTALLAGVFSFFNLFLLVYYDAKLALVAVLVISLGVGASSALGYMNVRHQRKLFGIQGKISGLALQFITGIGKLRLSGTEDRAFSIWAQEFAEQKRTAARSRIIQGLQTTFNSSFPLVAFMALFSWIALHSQDLIGAGDFSAFTAGFTNLQNALLQMFAVLLATLNIVPLMERAKPILETLPEVDVSKASPGVLTGDIEVSHVSFRYAADGPPILQDVNLQVTPGEFVALVGSSGSGKSTLLRLLLGFDTPEAGAVYYDGQDLSTLDVRAVRHQAGVVLQNGSIMAGDIFHNIVGSSNLTLDDAWEAARMAGFEEDIKDMPMGMHTMMPAGGGTLSGGQRQRLLIARAVVHKPRILFFDEATSALDNRTQEIVSRSLEKLQATRVVIAHRLSTIQHADRIFVLDKGRIVQHGTYEELMHQEGLFADLARRQIA